ncbi:hypothetical protein VTK26DRAFT_5558 [Humicola hyalothermophila]
MAMPTIRTLKHGRKLNESNFRRSLERGSVSKHSASLRNLPMHTHDGFVTPRVEERKCLAGVSASNSTLFHAGCLCPGPPGSYSPSAGIPGASKRHHLWKFRTLDPYTGLHLCLPPLPPIRFCTEAISDPAPAPIGGLGWPFAACDEPARGMLRPGSDGTPSCGRLGGTPTFSFPFHSHLGIALTAGFCPSEFWTACSVLTRLAGVPGRSACVDPLMHDAAISCVQETLDGVRCACSSSKSVGG